MEPAPPSSHAPSSAWTQVLTQLAHVAGGLYAIPRKAPTRTTRTAVAMSEGASPTRTFFVCSTGPVAGSSSLIMVSS
eukprot:1158935-Prymnesium_polylepis.1